MRNSVIELVEFLSVMIVAIVMALAGAAKILDPGPAITFMKVAYKIHVVLSEPLVYSMGALELLVASALALGIGRWRWPAVMSLFLVGLFAGILIEVHLRHPNVSISCGCFGKLQAPVGGASLLSHFALNLALAGCLGLHIFLAQRRFRSSEKSSSHRDS